MVQIVRRPAEYATDTGLTIIEFGIDDIDACHPSLSELVGHGNLAAYGDDAKADKAASAMPMRMSACTLP